MQYKLFFENSADAMLIVNEGRFVGCNTAAVTMFGCTSKSDIIHTVPADFSPEYQPDGQRSADKAAACIQQALEQGNLRFEWTHMRKDNVVFPAEVSLTMVEENGRSQLHVILRDISLRKRIQSNYQELFNASNEAVFVHDAETGKILDVNAGMLKMHGFDSKEEALCCSVADLSADEPAYAGDVAGDWIRRACSDGPQLFEWLSKRKNGETFWTEISLTAYETGGNKRVQAVCRDISAHKVAELALRKSEQDYRLLFENMTTGFVVFEVELGDAEFPAAFRFLEANPAAGKLLELEQKAFMGETMRGMLAPLEDPWFNLLVRVAKTGVASAYEGRMGKLGRVFEVWSFVPHPGRLAILFSDSTARWTAERAVLQAQQQLQHIINNTRDVIFQINLQGKYIYANTAAEQMTGYSVAELLNMSITDLVTPAHHQLVADRLEKRRAGRLEEGRFLVEIQPKKGLPKWIELATNEVFDSVGKIKAVQGVARDVTEQKRVDRLMQSLVEAGSTRSGKLFFEAMVVELGEALEADFTLIGEYSFGSQKKVQTLAVCQAGCVIDNFEYGVENSPCGEIYTCPISYASGVATLFQKDTLLQKGSIEGYVGVPLFNAKKEPLGIMVALFRKPLVDADFASSILQAFAGRTGVEIEREQNMRVLQRLSTAIDQTADTVVVTNAAGLIEYVNPAFEQTSGYTQEEVLGKTPRLLKSDKHPPEFYTQLWKTLFTGNVWKGQITNRHKDGSLYTEDTTFSPVHDAAGAITNYVAVKRDITKVLELEEQYRQAYQLESIGRMAGGVAHDFNNILQSILGFGGMLVSELKEGSPSHDDAQEILKAARRAAVLTTKLLTFSQQQSIGHATLDLNGLVLANERMLRRLISFKIDCVFNLQKNLPLMRGDASQIERILLNLFVNARDAMISDGRLEVATQVERVTERPGEFLCLSVSDSGCGIDADTKTHLFEPFFTTKAVGQGTGLGLSVVYGIVHQHGGWIDFSSEEGNGSLFKVYFPVHGDDPTKAAPS